MSGTSLLDHFSALEDPRQSWKVVYPLPEVLLVVLCATMAGAEDFVEIERWTRQKLVFLRRLLAFEKGIPSHDTLNDVMNALPAALFAECFTAWVETLRALEPDIVAIDGNTSRRPGQQRCKGRAAAFGSGTGAVAELFPDTRYRGISSRPRVIRASRDQPGYLGRA